MFYLISGATLVFFALKVGYYLACSLNLDGKQVIRGYHFHHSLWFVLPVTLIPLTSLSSGFLLGMSIGIVFEHRITWGGFYYITKAERHSDLKERKQIKLD